MPRTDLGSLSYALLALVAAAPATTLGAPELSTVVGALELLTTLAALELSTTVGALEGIAVLEREDMVEDLTGWY